MDLSDFATSIAGVNVKWVQFVNASDLLPADAVLVGCSPRAGTAALDQSVLVLDNRPEGYTTTTGLVAAAEDAYFADWPVWKQRPRTPQEVLDGITLVVEDVSPDSVWAVTALLARMAACDLIETLHAWLPAIERWERSGMVDDPFAEWPSLAAALGHAGFGRDPATLDLDYRSNWNDVLRFAGDCLVRQQGPTGMPHAADWPLLQAARAAIGQEEQAYHDWLPHALETQLSLPLHAGHKRRLLVDGLIFIEDQLTGAAKVFYRNDASNSQLRLGFTFAASYRPIAAPGSGEDFTITVDSRRGVHLREVWAELERRETAAWKVAGEDRPVWKPRLSRLGPYNEPWWLDDTCTLVAAPREVKLSADENALVVPGSKLAWHDIQAAIWSVCNPLTDVYVIATTGEPVPLLQLPPEPGETGWKTVLIARWPSSEIALPVPAPRSLGSAPIVDRVLAALIAHRGTPSPIGLGNLPPPAGGSTRVFLNGGFVIITSEGAFVLDDWRESAHLDLDAIRDVCRQACKVDQDLAELEQRHTAPLAREISQLLAGHHLHSERPELVVRAARISVRLAEMRARTALAPTDTEARLLRDALDTSWALDRRLRAMEQQMNAITGSLKALGDSLIWRVTMFVAIVGFPFYVANDLAMPLAKALVALARARGWLMPFLPAAGQEPPALWWWACFLVIFLSGLACAAYLRSRDFGRDNA